MDVRLSSIRAAHSLDDIVLTRRVLDSCSPVLTHTLVANSNRSPNFAQQANHVGAVAVDRPAYLLLGKLIFLR